MSLPEHPQPFRSYVDLAAAGRTSLPRILAGTLLVVVVATLLMIALMALGAFAIGFGWLAAPFGNDVIGADVFSAFLGSRAFLAAAILGIAGIWPGVWLALRLIHKRSLGSVLGLSRRIAWRDFARAMAATTLVAGIGIALNFMIDPSVRRSDMPVASWIWALPVMAAILLAQTSAEEVMFRGYLPQALATKYASPLVWAVLPALLFAILHWQPASGPLLLAIIIGAIAVFAAAATVLTVVTGNLGAAMGMHFANNVFAFLVMSSETPGRALSLYVARPLDDAGWTGLEILMLAVGQIAITGIILGLLVWRASPFCVRPKAVVPSPADRWADA